MLVYEFRWTFILLVLSVAFATVATYFSADHPSLGGAFFSSWMALFAQPLYMPPQSWYVGAIYIAYPLVGFGLVGEGLFRLGLLLNARRNNEREWMKLMASTARNHIVLCGLGTLGYRILQQLLETQETVVAIERDANGRFVNMAKEAGIAVLIRDAKDENALKEAGIEHARVIIVATSDDLANIEIALDTRRLNPKVKVVVRQFDQNIAAKLKEAGIADAAFSSTALAAPKVTEMALNLL